MHFISILILISFSIDCQTSTTDQLKWCPLIQTNGTSKELGIYRRFLNDQSETEYVMFNRDGEEWLFNITYHKLTPKYDIKLLNNTIQYNVKRVVHRFGIYRYDPVWSPDDPTHYQDCSVKREVNII